ncbi:MAG: nucleoside triphosphate pyrophosphohydrolase [Actinobacteria bacterium]|nr:nucleoside triphosphate pyrophosphohydrolase [Actinomycetota bacterium]
MDSAEIEASLGQLDQLTRRLRAECPWDREQTAKTIVPHTVEEAYELADAANSGDDEGLVDELGDVLFQVYFLSLLLEERGVSDLGQVADHCRRKLIGRHPHVFGDVEAANSAEVRRNWDRIKQSEPGRDDTLFGGVPENLPAPLHARRIQRRAASSGFDPIETPQAIDALRDQVDALADGNPDEHFEQVGDLLFAAVNVARKLQVDPELSLRSSSARFRGRLEAAEELARAAGLEWTELEIDKQLELYAQVRIGEEQ